MIDNSVYYNYPVKHMLETDIESIHNVDQYHHIYLCVYKINTNGKLPFLQYLLSINDSQELDFIRLKRHSSLHSSNIIDYSILFLSGILEKVYFEELKTNISFEGIFHNKNNLYIFLNITNCAIVLDEIYLFSTKRFALLDEILNCQHICNIPICKHVNSFFKSLDPYFLFVYNNKNKPYEIPIVAYVGKSTIENLMFCKTFGVSADNKMAFLGPYYYFTHFEQAIRQGGWSKDYKPTYINGKLITDNEYGRFTQGGIMRFALFMGTTKVIENLPNDEYDNSLIKQERLRDITLNSQYEMLTLRISDHDGKWKQYYDSIHLSDIELDDGNYIKESVPLYVVKQYNQQLPLSYHFIDKNSLGKCFDKCYKKYKIV